ncbi:hypothetical protein N431DRAFT_190035 [Stipitochalara longipes BDJ]|nr:hypothetical protein N431DRAFT_190035 [Stipitochalara longipes BDJ]
MKTRASKSSGKPTIDSTESAKSAGPKIQLGADSSNPPQILILPEGISNEARIVTLQNPRSLNESRYVVCPELGFYELKAFTEPKTTPRSWLLSQEVILAQNGAAGSSEVGLDIKKSTEPKGYVIRNGDLFVATPIDFLFLVLPALAPLPTSKNSESPKKLFLSSDDYLEKFASASPQFNAFLRTESIRVALEKRMAVVCDVVDAGDETMYRFNEEKLLDEILRKAKKMIAQGLPSSIEEKFIRKALDVPILGISREESLLDGNQEDTVPEGSGSQTLAADTSDTQTTVSSTDTAASSFSRASTIATSFTEDSMPPPLDKKLQPLPTITAPDGVADLLRLRTAVFFICSNYLAPHLSESLKRMVSSSTTMVDFNPLNAHLAYLAKMRQEAVSMRSFGDFSRKRSMVEDEDSETRAEKKRKKEEEEKRKKAGESRGVKNLKKVNVTGMKKMSDFFKKK